MFKLTYPSEYDSLLLWILDQVHLVIPIATAAAVLSSQSAHSVFFTVGAIGSTVVARVAKEIISEPRPLAPGGEGRQPVKHKKTSGMPSSHSTALSYYFFYLFPLLPLVSPRLTAERAGLTAAWGGVLWSRIKLGYHTPPQVLGGIACGAAVAFVWSALWRTFPGIEAHLQPPVDAVCRLVHLQ